MTEPVPHDVEHLAALLEAMPGGAFLLDAVGTIRYATVSAAQLVDRRADELVGQSVLSFVDEDTAWTYAAAVAMASDYPEVVTGPMRVTVVAATGEHREADLWASNRLDDPVLQGIVCLLTPASSAMGLSEAIQGLATGATFEEVATRLARAMAGNPVVSDAALVAVTAGNVRRVDSARSWMPDLDDGPWIDVAVSGARQVLTTIDELPEGLAEAARAAGFATVWVEPVGSGPPPARGSIVLWRRRPGRPSPNQLNAIHQAAAIGALAWDRHEALE